MNLRRYPRITHHRACVAPPPLAIWIRNPEVGLAGSEKLFTFKSILQASSVVGLQLEVYLSSQDQFPPSSTLSVLSPSHADSRSSGTGRRRLDAVEEVWPGARELLLGKSLNRLSFLRTDHDFLKAAFSHPSAAFLLMNNLAPLVKGDASHLAFVNHADVAQLTGKPFEKKEEDLIKDFNSEETQPVILFLGIDDKNRLPTTRNDSGAFEYKNYKGSPYFAVDVTPKGSAKDTANAIIESMKEKGYSFQDSSPRHMGLVAGEGE